MTVSSRQGTGRRRPRRVTPNMGSIWIKRLGPRPHAPSPAQPGFGRESAAKPFKLRLLPRLNHLIDCGGSFFNRTFSYVDLRPPVASEQAPRQDQLAADSIEVGIVAAEALAVAMLEAEHALASAPDMRERFGVDGESDDQRPLQLRQPIELLTAR